ncbi:hypothetical protein AYO37_00180 [Opitutia bacterium SCGC AG-212-L18]|nr:hypothetical protein AYO37_00180 [Opitutae bacterium SCGC AG-212-L18]
MKTIKKIGLLFPLLIATFSMNLLANEEYKEPYQYSLELSNKTHNLLFIDIYYRQSKNYPSHVYQPYMATLSPGETRTISHTDLHSMFVGSPTRISIGQQSYPIDKKITCSYSPIDINQDRMSGTLKPEKINCTLPLTYYNISKFKETGKIKISVRSNANGSTRR